MPVFSPSGCSFAEAGQYRSSWIANQARLHPNPFSSKLRTSPRVKQYLDKMIAHCEGLAGKVEPTESSGADRRYAVRSRMSRNHNRLQPRSFQTRREEE